MFNSPADANQQTLHNAIPIHLSIASSSEAVALGLIYPTCLSFQILN